MIPHEYIEELTRRTDIVELVGSYVQLKRKGRLYGGLCPFHSEKTPSFYVYPDTQSFYCFGCQAAGDAISFVKKINNISSGEAIKMLASRAGMPEPQEDDKTGRLRSRVLSMNKEAARFFHACLNSTVEEARQVLKDAPGVKLVDDLPNLKFPMPLDTSDQDIVFVGRIRPDLVFDNGLCLWCCGDQVRKGAATNAIQIAELLVKE